MQSTQHKYRGQLTIPNNFSYRFLIDGEYYVGKIKSVSLNGCFLSHPSPLFLQAHVSRIGELQLRLDGEWQTLKCEVVYVQTPDSQIFPVGAGLVFCDGDDAAKDLISKLNAAINQSEFSLINMPNISFHANI